MSNLWPCLLFSYALSSYLAMEQVSSHACLASLHRTAADWRRSLEGGRCRSHLSPVVSLLPISAHSYTWSLIAFPLQALLEAYPPFFRTTPLIPTWSRSKEKEGPCYFKWSLTQLHKEHKIKPFSQAITPRQLKQTENSITARYCRIWCSLSLHALGFWKKGWEGGKGHPPL